MKQVQSIQFNEYNECDEGVVMLGCGGNIDEWIKNVTLNLNTYNVVFGDVDQVWEKTYKLETTGGRVDVVLVLNLDSHFDPELYAKWLENAPRIIHIDEYSNVFHTHHLVAPTKETLH